MADIQANIGIGVDTSQALASIRQLQREISAFHTSMAKGGAAAQAATANMQQNLINSVNATGKFNAQLTTIKTTTESFTNSLEKNKLSMGQYFKYGMASTKTFGSFFRNEFATINKVARERVKDLQTQYVKMGRDANGAMKAIAVRPLALDMENVATRTAIAAQKQQLFNQLLKQGSTNLLNFGKNTQWAGRQLMVGFTIPLSILGMTASRVFMNMEKQAIAFRKVYGDLFTPEAEREKALKDIENLGTEFTKYGIAVADTIGLAADAAAAGFAGADLQSQTAQATKLAVLGQIDTQKALETTIALQNAFKMSNEELAESINFLNAVENQTVVSLDDITTAIPKVAPVIKSLGGDVQDLAFFLSAMKEGGVNAAEGANALKSGLARIINPTQKATEFMGSLGINIKGIVEQNAGDLMGTMMTLGQALDQLDPLNRSRAIEQLFGRFQFARISTLFDNITKQGTQASRVADLATASIEELASLSEGELAVVSESTTAKFQSAFEKLKAELAPVGEEFLKLATPFVEFGTKVLEAFNNMGDGSKRIIMGIITVVGAIGPVALMTFGLMMNGIANLVKTFAVLRNAFSRSKQDTQTLGHQFEYLTQEQIQAASVAASLDQVHSQLKQTFTSEASAVDRLRAAYERAIVSQNRFRGPVTKGSKVVPPKGYASGGIVSGPGTGTSDSIAAMISNGEAIIPAAMVEKYGGLVQGIISDQIPGFAEGLIPTYPEYSLRLQDKSENTAQRASGGTSYENILSPLAVRVGEARGITPGKAAVGAGKFDSIAQEFEALTQKFTQKLNKEFDTTFKNIEDTNERYAKAWKSAGKAVEKDVNKIKSDVDRGVVRKTFGLDPDYYGSAPTEPRRKGSKELTRARRSVEKGGPRSYTTVGVGARELFSRRTGKSAANLQMGHVFGPVQQEVETLAKSPKASNAIKRAAQRMGFNLEKAVVDGVNSAAQSKSPSKKARKAGGNIAQGAIQGIQSGTDDAQRAGARIGTAVANGAAGGGGRPRDPKSGRFTKTPNTPVGIPASGRRAPSFDKFNRGLMASSFAMTSLSSVAMFAGGETGKLAEVIAKVSGGMFALTGVIELVGMALNSQIGQGLVKKLGGTKLGGAFKTLIKSPLKFGVAITGVVGVLGLLAVGGMLLYKAHQKQKLAIEGLGNVANMSSKKIQELGDVFGITATSGGLSRGFAPALQGVDAETQSGAQQLVGSETFQQTFAKDIEAIKNGAAKDVELALQTLGARLESSGFAQDQVQAIVNALLSEAGRTDVVLDFATLGVSSEAARQGLTESLASARDSLANMPLPAGPAGGSVSISGTSVSAGDTGYSAYGTESSAGLPSPERLQAIDQYASSLYGTFDALGQGVEKGLISVEDFDQTMNKVLADFDELSQADQQDVFKKLLEDLPEGSEDFKELLGTVDDFDSKMALVRAKSTGMLDDEVIDQYAKELKNAEKNGQSVIPILERMNNLQSEAVETQAALTEQKIVDAAVTAGTDEIEKRAEAAQQQVDVYNGLIEAGVPAAQAQEMIANSTITAALAAAAGTEEFGVLIDQYNSMANLESKVAKITSSGGGAAAKQSSSIDKLTESLRNLVNANAQLGEGFTQSSRAIESALSSGTDGFNGLSQSLRSLGASEDLINLVVGMPPEEFSKYKNTLFDFDPATKSIVGLRAAAQKLGSALKSIAIGKFIEEQRAFIVNTQNQISAVSKLRSAGLSYADALKVVQDQSVATAIATAATTAELNEILRITQEVADLQAQMDREQARSQAAESVRQTNEEFRNQVAVLQNLSKARGEYTDSQISALMSDTNLQKLMLDPSIDSGALKEALRNAEQKANLEVSVNLLTKTGQETEFDKYLSEVNDYFTKKENSINVNFQAATADDNKLLEDAQSQVAAIQYELDDYNAELERISWQEEDINDKYKKRAEALDDVAKSNQRINGLQKAQLGIAEALSRGDIAAAAAAQQQLRDSQTKDAQALSKENLEKQRQRELSSIVGASGMTREQLEAEIETLERKVFGLQESSIEPAEERNRIAEVSRNLAIEQLQLNEMTRAEFDQIAASTKESAVNMEDMATSAEKLVALSEYIKTGIKSDSFNELFPAPKAAAPSKPKTSSSSSRSSSPAPAAAPAPAPQQSSLKTSVKNLDKQIAAANEKKATQITGAAEERERQALVDAKRWTLKALYYQTGSASYNSSGGMIVPKRMAVGGMVGSVSGPPLQMAMGGKVKGYPMGGLIPYKSEGGFFKSLGSDTVPAMLTPGEYVVRRPAVKEFGVKNLEDINRGTYGGESMYNYNLQVNVKSDSDPNKIANTVMRSIKQIEGQRVRGNRI